MLYYNGKKDPLTGPNLDSGLNLAGHAVGNRIVKVEHWLGIQFHVSWMQYVHLLVDADI
jgi:hypothetical protein